MKLKIWSPDISKECQEDQLFLQLIQTETGDILLSVYDKQGNKIPQGNLLIIDKDLKCFVTLEDVNDKIPLKTDLYDSVMVVSQAEVKKRVEEQKSEYIKSRIFKEIVVKMTNDDEDSSDNFKKEVH